MTLDLSWLRFVPREAAERDGEAFCRTGSAVRQQETRMWLQAAQPYTDSVTSGDRQETFAYPLRSQNSLPKEKPVY